jgi:hypothetical protein
MEQANRLTLRSVSRAAPAGVGISDYTVRQIDTAYCFGIRTPPAQCTLQIANFLRGQRQLQRRPNAILEPDCARREFLHIGTAPGVAHIGITFKGTVGTVMLGHSASRNRGRLQPARAASDNYGSRR